MKIKDAALREILAEVEGEIATLLKSEKAKLAKASEESPGESSPAEGSAGGGEASASAGGPPAAAGGAPSPAPADPASAGMSAGPAGAAPAAPADPAAGGGMDAGAPPSLEELAAEYAKLPPEELKMHYLAAKTALFQVMGAADGGAGAGAPGAAPSPAPVGGPPAGGPPGASPSASPAGDVPPAPPAMKGEMPWGSKTVGNDESGSDGDPKPSGTGMTKPVITEKGSKLGKGSMPYGSKKEGNDEHGSDSDPTPSGTGQTKPVVNSVTKSESDELDELRKGQDQMVKILETLLTVPERKAWTGTEIQYIKKSEESTRSTTSRPLKKSLDEFTVADVNAKLNEVTRNPKLAKSDRERINMFYANQLDLEGIKDLLIEG